MSATAYQLGGFRTGGRPTERAYDLTTEAHAARVQRHCDRVWPLLMPDAVARSKAVQSHADAGEEAR